MAALDAFAACAQKRWAAAPLIGARRGGQRAQVVDPADHRRTIGSVGDADISHVDRAITRAIVAQWRGTVRAATRAPPCSTGQPT